MGPLQEVHAQALRGERLAHRLQRWRLQGVPIGLPSPQVSTLSRERIYRYSVIEFLCVALKGNNLWKLFCNMFCESSPCFLGQHGSCICSGALRKHLTKPSQQVYQIVCHSFISSPTACRDGARNKGRFTFDGELRCNEPAPPIKVSSSQHFISASLAPLRNTSTHPHQKNTHSR